MNKLEISLEAASDRGLVRENNEDMILVGHETLRSDMITKTATVIGGERYLVALADGMGGHKGGDVASEMMLRNLDTFFYDITPDLSNDDLIDSFFTWLASVNRCINGRGREDANLRGMGTTLVAFIVYNQKFFWANCGDSRLYRVRDGEIRQLTTDHSLDMLTGLKSDSNVLLNCIGGCCQDSYLDILQMDDVRQGDIYILCSDGLTDMVEDDQLLTYITQGASAADIVKAANDAGGFDNISVSIVKIDQLD